MLINLDVLINIFAAYQTVEQQIAKGCDDNPVTRHETCNVGHQTLDNGQDTAAAYQYHEQTGSGCQIFTQSFYGQITMDHKNSIAIRDI